MSLNGESKFKVGDRVNIAWKRMELAKTNSDVAEFMDEQGTVLDKTRNPWGWTYLVQVEKSIGGYDDRMRRPDEYYMEAAR